jgi:hypothetical protein
LRLLGNFVESPSFFQTISRLPLEVLFFAADSIIVPSDLTNLVSGSAKVETLRTIQLDFVEFERGKPIPRNFLESSRVVVISIKDYEAELGWKLSGWPEECSQEHLRELIELGEEEGVEVIGTAVEALKIAGEWREEARYYDSAVRGSQQG